MALSATPARRLREDTFALATPEGRLPGTAGHDAARRFIEARFAEIGLAPLAPAAGFGHPYRADKGLVVVGDGIEMTNLVGVVAGRDRTAPPILLGAHYDSVIAAPCAGDNAAAVAAILEVARHVPAGSLERDLLVVAFDAEEPPHFLGPDMGSMRLAAEVLGDAPVQLAIVLDLVGHALQVPGLRPDLMFVTGAESHRSLPGLLDGLGTPLAAAPFRRVDDYSDYAVFRRAGAPYLFFSCGEWTDYHRPSDLPERLDYAKVARLAGDLVQVVRRADGVTTEYDAAFDATEFEIETMERTIGSEFLSAAAAQLGLDGYETAEQLDSIVWALRAKVRGGL